MKRFLAAGLLILALPAGAAARRAVHHSCTFKGAKTVASDSVGRTFFVTSGSSYGQTQTYGVCLYATGVPRYLVQATGGEVEDPGVLGGLTSVDRAVMSGPFAAIYGTIDSADTRQMEPKLFVFDVRRRYNRRSTGPGRFHGAARVVRDLPNTTAELPPSERPAPELDKVLLSADGAVAWTEELRSAGTSAVFSDDRTGPHTLDPFSNTVLPDTLALHGSTLSWQDGQQTLSATLN